MKKVKLVSGDHGLPVGTILDIDKSYRMNVCNRSDGQLVELIRAIWPEGSHLDTSLVWVCKTEAECEEESFSGVYVEVEEEENRPKVGDQVYLPEYGSVGIIAMDDGSSLPFFVNEVSGTTYGRQWFRKDEVRVVGTSDNPLAEWEIELLTDGGSEPLQPELEPEPEVREFQPGDLVDADPLGLSEVLEVFPSTLKIRPLSGNVPYSYEWKSDVREATPPQDLRGKIGKLTSPANFGISGQIVGSVYAMGEHGLETRIRIEGQDGTFEDLVENFREIDHTPGVSRKSIKNMISEGLINAGLELGQSRADIKTVVETGMAALDDFFEEITSESRHDGYDEGYAEGRREARMELIIQVENGLEQLLDDIQ